MTPGIFFLKKFTSVLNSTDTIKASSVSPHSKWEVGSPIKHPPPVSTYCSLGVKCSCDCLLSLGSPPPPSSRRSLASVTTAHNENHGLNLQQVLTTQANKINRRKPGIPAPHTHTPFYNYFSNPFWPLHGSCKSFQGSFIHQPDQ